MYIYIMFIFILAICVKCTLINMHHVNVCFVFLFRICLNKIYIAIHNVCVLFRNNLNKER